MRVPIVVVLALLLAGCASPKETATTESVGTASVRGPAAVNASAASAAGAAPTWHKGDAWAITISGGAASESLYLVVVAASSTDYTLASTSPTMATFDAIYDVSYVGKIRAADLAGAQHDTPVRFFDFPLADGKTWTTPWDGIDVTLTAKASPAGFAIEGTTNGTSYVKYDYTPALKWWSHIDFASGFGLKVDRAVENWTGAVIDATAKSVFDSTTAVPVVTFNTQTFHVDEGQTSVLLTLAGGGSAWARALALVTPGGQPYQTASPNTEVAGAPRGVFVSEPLPADPGDWKITAPIAHHPDGWFHLQVFEIVLAQRMV